MILNPECTHELLIKELEMKQPITIEELEDALRDARFNPSHLQLYPELVYASQFTLNLMRKIEAGEVRILPYESTSEIINSITGVLDGNMECGEDHQYQLAHQIYKAAIKSAPQDEILNEIWGSE